MVLYGSTPCHFHVKRTIHLLYVFTFLTKTDALHADLSDILLNSALYRVQDLLNIMDLCIFNELQKHPRYSPTQFLKRGAFGSVLIANNKETGEQVALKVIKRQEGDDTFVASEVLNQMRLHHAHVVPLIEVFAVRDHLVLVMELAAGGDLASYVPWGRGLVESTACWLFQQIAFALHYCHEMGVACRDIKLENVLVASPAASLPIVKLADFGLSAYCAGSPLLPSHAVAQMQHQRGSVGTPAYMAPEVVRAAQGQAGSYDVKAADMWSCGVLLHVLLTGALPFRRETDAALGRREGVQAMLERIKAAEYQIPQGISQECGDLLSWMLSADPANRPTAAQVVAHPWCCKGVDARHVLGINLRQLEASMAAAPAAELVTQVLDLLKSCSKRTAAPPAAPPPSPPGSPFPVGGDAAAHFSDAESSGSVTEPFLETPQ